MKNEFALAFNEVLEEKGLPKDIVIEAIEAALASAYRRHVNASNAQHVEAAVDSETGKVTIYVEKEVVDIVEDTRTEVALEVAKSVDENATLGSMVVVESTPNNFGRVAAQTARQVIQQRIREAERDSQFNYFTKQLGEIVNGVVQAINAQGVALGLEMKAEGLMPRPQMIPGERFRLHDRVRALLLEVKSSPRGPQIILSRGHRNFLRRLLENEVPEIYHGMVEIRSIAREPGQRSKVAVSALQTGVDPVGACVGIRGVRIQAIVRELSDEKIDVIEWSSDPAVYIAKALSPARVAGVYLNEQSKSAKTATVVVPEDQLSLAIGRDGQNARLAAKLTAWRIDIKSLPEAAADALNKLLNDPSFASILVHEADTIPAIETVLAKKGEGRPVTPEEYHLLTQFVDRIERGLIRQRQDEARAEEQRQRIAVANVPEQAFEVPLDEFKISDRLFAVISESGLQNVGELMVQLQTDPDVLWRLSGMGPKAMAELRKAVEDFTSQYPVEVGEIIESESEIKLEEVAVLAEAIEEVGLVKEFEPSTTEPILFDEIEATPVVESIEAEAAIDEEKAELLPEELVGLQPEGVEPVIVGEVGTPEEEEITSFDELFALRPEALGLEQIEEEEPEEETDKKKKKKKKKFTEVEYDPDKDVVLLKKKRKRGAAEWEEGW